MSTTRKLLLITAAIALIGVSIQSAVPSQAKGTRDARPMHHHDGKTTSHSGPHGGWSAGGARTKPNVRANPPSPVTIDSVIQGSRFRF